VARNPPQPPLAPGAPRPPEGDWLGTPYLSFQREGPIAVCTIDRPDARNAMTPAMYFGIRYAVGRLNADPDLAGLLITGTGDVFAHGGDMTGGGGADDWITFGAALGMDVTPFDAVRTSGKQSSPRSTDCARAAASRSRCAATCRW
jgi:enoyl-CoA hydratase